MKAMRVARGSARRARRMGRVGAGPTTGPVPTPLTLDAQRERIIRRLGRGQLTLGQAARLMDAAGVDTSPRGR